MSSDDELSETPRGEVPTPRISAHTLYAQAKELVDTLDRAVRLASDLGVSTEFEALCDRWNTWHDEWRTEPQWQNERSYYSQPTPLHARNLKADTDHDGELYFEEYFYRSGDTEIGTMPLEYVRDPDAWEREREAAGDIISRAQWTLRKEAQTQEVAYKTRAAMIETLEAAGFKVTRTEGM